MKSVKLTVAFYISDRTRESSWLIPDLGYLPQVRGKPMHHETCKRAVGSF